MYCYKCGKKANETPSGVFDISTGEELVDYKCPSGMCGHLGFELHNWERVGGFSLFLATSKCKVCSKTVTDKWW